MILHIYSYEVYPIVLSSKGFTFNFVFRRLGSSINYILLEFFGSILVIPLGILGFLCLFISLSLTETVIMKNIENFPSEKITDDGGTFSTIAEETETE